MAQHDEDGPVPSSRSAQRYADGVHAEVGDLRATLRAALDEAERHEAAGRPDLAVTALERQRAALAQVHARLEHLTAAVAVEREAEDVLHAAAATLPAGPTPARSPGSRRRGRVVVAATTFATVATGAALALTGPPQAPPSAPAVVAVAPVEVESAPPPPSTPTDGGAGSDRAASGATTDRQDRNDRTTAAATGGPRAVDTGAPGDDATPSGRLDVFVRQVVETLTSLLGDGAAADDGVEEDGPATDQVQDLVPTEPASAPGGPSVADDAPTGRDASGAEGADGVGTGLDELP